MTKLLAFIIVILLGYNTFINAQTVTDYDGNVYQTVIIGNQEWMAENVKSVHYSDGTPITHVSGNANWIDLIATDKAYCYYNDDSLANASTYGALYTWAAAMNGAASNNNIPSGVQGVCPTGWHLPSDAEWEELEVYLSTNGYNYDGTIEEGRGKIGKSLASTSSWNSSTVPGAIGNTDYPEYRNKSGFTALPGGYRTIDGEFNLIGDYGIWRTATENEPSTVWHRRLYSEETVIDMDSYYKNSGFSVRCVKNGGTSINSLNEASSINIYPNPTQGIIHINSQNKIHASVFIYNLAGKMLQSERINEVNNTLNLTELTKGIYIIKIQSDYNIKVEKLIIE